MSKKLFVGGLSWGTSENNLRDAFARFGEIEDARIITDRHTGRSRGFGFITFEDESAAQQAIEEMDGTTLDSRSIKVNEAQERPPRRGGRREFNRGGGQDTW